MCRVARTPQAIDSSTGNDSPRIGPCRRVGWHAPARGICVPSPRPKESLANALSLAADARLSALSGAAQSDREIGCNVGPWCASSTDKIVQKLAHARDTAGTEPLALHLLHPERSAEMMSGIVPGLRVGWHAPARGICVPSPRPKE